MIAPYVHEDAKRLVRLMRDRVRNLSRGSQAQKGSTVIRLGSHDLRVIEYLLDVLEAADERVG